MRQQELTGEQPVWFDADACAALYPVQVQYDVEAMGHVAVAPAFPNVTAFALQPGKAVEKLRKKLTGTVKGLLADGQALPPLNLNRLEGVQYYTQTVDRPTSDHAELLGADVRTSYGRRGPDTAYEVTVRFVTRPSADDLCPLRQHVNGRIHKYAADVQGLHEGRARTHQDGRLVFTYHEFVERNPITQAAIDTLTGLDTGQLSDEDAATLAQVLDVLHVFWD